MISFDGLFALLGLRGPAYAFGGHPAEDEGRHAADSSTLDMPKTRYARGEIVRDEFVEPRKELAA